MDRLSKKDRSVLMSKVGTTGTDIEKKLLKIVNPFWKKKRYRKNVRNLPGKPDVVFLKNKLTIFADGDFWHGKDFEKWKNKIPKFWRRKIEDNIRRDKRQSMLLKKAGYKVLRLWGLDIKKHPEKITEKIRKMLN
ncbi:MAG: DUF559 domain-containing protein [Parcubacteria group bacterium]|jgi:DNA mismatch endonuclease (patch repair protein)